MTFLSWQTIALAAGLTLPPLIALYFLKLKRTVRLVPTTMLWRRAVEDLQVNSPFQRLRRSLLLLLQLLVLALAAIALGKPMLESAETTESTVLLLIDQSASMAVIEEGGASRLALAKQQARQTIDSLGDDARAMIIEFCDRGAVVSSFDTDKEALKRKIDTIEQTLSSTTLTEAISLAEAYAQNLVIGGEMPGTDIISEAAPPATVFIYTDGRIEDARQVAVQKFDVSNLHMVNVGQRRDNVGIIAMDASRNYEQPAFLEVTAVVENFGPEAQSVDAVLYVEGKNVDVQTVRLDPFPVEGTAPSGGAPDEKSLGHIQVAAFDQILFEGGGVVEVRLRIDDALSADDQAWTIIDPPRSTRVLLVTDGNLVLEKLLPTLPIELSVMSTAGYEGAEEESVTLEGRSLFDVVIFDRHSTARLPQGNYLFFAAVPQVEEVSVGPTIDTEVIFDWDGAHAILRHVAVETIVPVEWRKLNLPPHAVSIVDGQTSPVLAYLTREGSQYLICAMGPIVRDEQGAEYLNGEWVASAGFVVLLQNMIHYLAGNIATTGRRGVRPGEPTTVPIPENVETVKIRRPDGVVTSFPTGRYQSLHYAQTRKVGLYQVDPGVPGRDRFAVNLFNENEGRVAPAETLAVGTTPVAAKSGETPVNQPAWTYFLLAVLAFLVLEWIVYNRRVLV